MGHARRIAEQLRIAERYQCDLCETRHATVEAALACCEDEIKSGEVRGNQDGGSG